MVTMTSESLTKGEAGRAGLDARLIYEALLSLRWDLPRPLNSLLATRSHDKNFCCCSRRVRMHHPLPLFWAHIPVLGADVAAPSDAVAMIDVEDSRVSVS